jgi:hypothetical protein
MVTYEDEKLAKLVETCIKGAFIGGSWLTSQGIANDIDVVCSDSQFPQSAHYDWFKAFTKDVSEQSAKYNTDDADEDYELVANYRKDNVNLIVVADKFYPAYKAARDAMIDNPERFKTRELRVWLHTTFKNHIRKMWQDELWMKSYPSPVPVSFSALG